MKKATAIFSNVMCYILVAALMVVIIYLIVLIMDVLGENIVMVAVGFGLFLAFLLMNTLRKWANGEYDNEGVN